ncbi:MAG TPA: hypothetical protein VNG53_04745 [Bacteroidia bacterium]|nr:hypothetical protein [Bacteroidia bacterium]
MQLKNIFSKNYFSYGIVLAIALRIICCFISPYFSSDIVRFVWDGKLFLHGVNPFIYIPSYLVDNTHSVQAGVNYAFFSLLNSPNNYTHYGPFLQYIFTFCNRIFGMNMQQEIIFLRLLIAIAELGSVFIMLKILRLFEIAEKNIFWYLLNPLVIFELYTNVHVEIIPVFFLMAAIYFLLREKIFLSALLLAFAASCDLIYLMPLLFILPKLDFKRIFFYLVSCLAFLTILFLPFLMDGKLIHLLISNATGYFATPEFNSVLFIITNSIETLLIKEILSYQTGLLLFEIATLALVFYAFNVEGKSPITLVKNIFFGFVICLVLSSAIKPADFILLLALSVFIPFRFVFVWSVFALFTYVSYLYYPPHDNFILLILEYISVSALFIYEWKKDCQKNNFSEQVSSN